MNGFVLMMVTGLSEMRGITGGLGGGNTFGNQFNGIDLGLADPTMDNDQLVSALGVSFLFTFYQF